MVCSSYINKYTYLSIHPSIISVPPSQTYSSSMTFSLTEVYTSTKATFPIVSPALGASYDVFL